MTISPRERRLLVLLVGVAGLATLRIVWLAASPPEAAAGGSSARQRGGRAARATSRATAEAVIEIRSDRLAASPREFAVGRDLFRYGPPPPPPPPSAAELERQRREAEERRRAAEQAAEETAIPRPPAVTVRYLGSFGPDRQRIAVFRSSDGENVFNAAEGDQLEGKFVLLKIGFESVDLGFVGFPDAAARRLGLSE